MKIAIVGWGIEGKSVYHYFGADHQYLITNEAPPHDLPPESEGFKVQYIDKPRQPGVTGNVKDLSYLDGIENCDKIVYTPTAYPNLKQKYGDDADFWGKTTTVTEIFFENVKTRNIIGVTGTKGKGTTSTLITKILEVSGKRVFLGGNIGNSVLDFLNDVRPDDWAVLEMSNFQLRTLNHSPHIAVCLMIVPEHMDWHKDMAEYVAAKANIFKYQKPDDVAVYFGQNQYSRQIAQLSPGKKVPYFENPGAFVRNDGMIVIGDNETEIIRKEEVKLLGNHNLQNVCAALTAVHEAIGETDQAKTVLQQFSGLEHRLEFVRELDGVQYYDDSFGTTPETAIVAIEAFAGPKVLILGGSDKGADFNQLADVVVRSSARHVITIGETGSVIEKLLKSRNFVHITRGPETMDQIVKVAQKVAQPGDVVLLSTGCASFGMFRDYKDRGNQFKQAVRALA